MGRRRGRVEREPAPAAKGRQGGREGLVGKVEVGEFVLPVRGVRLFDDSGGDFGRVVS